ncbi:baseplate assembly protein [Spartinivicinus poritis]|uniref:Baseplate J/gp47 family protein n=1 Tax=Spartinivicinus poritis TaxID=2994640 RepID=A0ABT5UGV4_9GAMM|nr:baseplate J/gp47 family protein [Spartinivicinus sp. A2-2]MDE1465606.1 baseplate J/gp47 family protein [Spartinivicinus sp. A2-2]
MTNAINLSQLPAPDVVETLDYEAILDEILTDLKKRDSEFTALVESDPAYKILEVVSYRELIIRQRINDAARAVMVAYARGKDLDHLAALFRINRLLIEKGNPNVIPPTEDQWESDDRLRERIVYSLEGLSTAGPKGAYRYHALSASALVKDVSVESPSPGQVVVTVLSTQGQGVPSEDIITAVETQLNDEDIRPLTDQVFVKPAEIIHYQINAELTYFTGPDITLVTDEATQRINDYVKNQHRLGLDITLSGIYSALHIPGVQNVKLISPSQNITVSPAQAAYCTQIIISKGAADE